jgi:uncharacterized coiled-coil protein SlyX
MVEVGRKELSIIESLAKEQEEEIKSLKVRIQELEIALDKSSDHLNYLSYENSELRKVLYSVSEYVKDRVTSDKERRVLSEKNLIAGYKKLGETIKRIKSE